MHIKQSLINSQGGKNTINTDEGTSNPRVAGSNPARRASIFKEFIKKLPFYLSS
jgi:hypothetical protein